MFPNCKCDGAVRCGGNVIILNEKATLGNFTHELLHALGLSHEHQRYDRDNFVSVNLRNVPSWALAYQFAPLAQKRHDFSGDVWLPASWHDFPWHLAPYDHGSIMHYGDCAKDAKFVKDTYFARAGYTTAADGFVSVPSLFSQIGQRAGMSAGDVAKLLVLYGAKEAELDHLKPALSCVCCYGFPCACKPFCGTCVSLLSRCLCNPKFICEFSKTHKNHCLCLLCFS